MRDQWSEHIDESARSSTTLNPSPSRGGRFFEAPCSLPFRHPPSVIPAQAGIQAGTKTSSKASCYSCLDPGSKSRMTSTASPNTSVKKTDLVSALWLKLIRMCSLKSCILIEIFFNGQNARAERTTSHRLALVSCEKFMELLNGQP